MLFLLLLFIFQIAKAQQPTRKAFIPRTIDWGYRIIEGDSSHPRKHYIFPFPIVAYKPETRWIFGISVTNIFKVSKDSITRPSFVQLNIAYSQERQLSVIPMMDYFTKNNKINIRASYTYTNFAEYFWGIGYNTPAENKENYAFKMHKANIKIAHQFVKHLYGGVRYSYEKMFAIEPVKNGLLESSGVTGANGYTASGVGFTLYYDNRDHVYFPHKGSLVEISNAFYRTAFGSNHNFSNITIDARKFVHLWRDNVLALQGFANLNEGDVPFRMNGVLGSDMFMRGYYNGRYRDKHAMAFQAELRKTIWGPFAGILFVGGGTVANQIPYLTNNIKPNYGVGLRIKAIPKERINIRIDYGFGSKGNSALYISMNEAF